MRLSGNFIGASYSGNQIINRQASVLSTSKDSATFTSTNNKQSFQGFKLKNLIPSVLKGNERKYLAAQLSSIYRESKRISILERDLKKPLTAEEHKNFQDRCFQLIEKVTPKNFDLLKSVLSEIIIPVKIKTHAIDKIEAQIIRGKHVEDNVDILKSVFKGKIDLSDCKDIGYINAEVLENNAVYFRKAARVMREASSHNPGLRSNLVNFFKNLIREVKNTTENYPHDNKPMRNTASNFLLKTIGRENTARFFISEFQENVNTPKSKWLAKQVFRPTALK